jgi:hypothetical protein
MIPGGTAWQAAGQAIIDCFADPEPIIYTGAGLVAQPLTAVRSDWPAPAFAGPGETLRKITYEIQKQLLPEEPSKRNSFTHRGMRWAVDDITSRDDVDAWELVVSIAGPAS